MADNPIYEAVVDGEEVPKNEFRAAFTSLGMFFESLTVFRNTDTRGQKAVIIGGLVWVWDQADTTTADNGVNCIIDLSGVRRYKTQQPSYVDEVIEVANFAALPGTGNANKIYLTLDNGKTYRWSGSRYVETTPTASLLAVIVVARDGTRAEKNADYLCDGVADQVQINAAIAAASAAGGGQVFVGAGVYNTAQPVVMSDNVDLVFEPGAIVRPSVGWTGLANATAIISAVAKTNFKIIGSIVDCVTNNISANGIEARPDSAFAGTPCSHYDIVENDVRLKKNAHVYGIWSMRGKHARILNNIVKGGYLITDTWTGLESQEGIEVYGGTDVLVQGNQAIGIGNIAYNIIGLTDIVGQTGMSEINVTDNFADICGRAIAVTVSSHTTNGMAGMVNSSIKGNRVTNVFVSGIYVQFVSSASNGAPIVFKNNQFDDNIIEMASTGQLATSYGLFINNERSDTTAIASSGNTFNGNKFSNVLNTDAGGRWYILFFSGWSARENETISPSQASGISRSAVLIGCSDFSIVGNKFDGARVYGMQLFGCSSGRIVGNEIRNWNIYAGGVAGIRFEANGAVECTDIEVSGNNFKTSVLTNVGVLVQLTPGCARFEYADNYYVGAGYTGVRVSYTGSNAMNNSKYDLQASVLLADAATVTPNFGLASNFEWVIGGNRTLANPVNAKLGQSGKIRVLQDATGSRVITYGANWRFPGGTAVGGVLSTAASAVDVIEYTVGSDGRFYANLTKGYSI
jgi:hypothetical protein